MTEGESQPRQPWLLIHQLPIKPAYFRGKIRPPLQGVGAVAVESSVYYGLPANAETTRLRVAAEGDRRSVRWFPARHTNVSVHQLEI
jgi:hypothetical protein